MDKAKIGNVLVLKVPQKNELDPEELRKKTIALKYAVKKKARRELPGSLFKVYDAIFDRCGGAQLSTWVLSKTIAKELGIKIGTVRNRLYAIEKKGFIYRQYIADYTYINIKDGKKKSIKNFRLITLILNPERFQQAAKDSFKNKVKEIVERFTRGELTRAEYEEQLNNVGYIE